MKPPTITALLFSLLAALCLCACGRATLIDWGPATASGAGGSTTSTIVCLRALGR